ncbi:probable RNA-directed DNA polymerase from transposon X-element [Caerostris extrusa]|uniref:Probable RNA-directed DNA polymerase from transposon X-element n=1 Tax=Caerostris extrusa TaxID=172846 RepID=A0AAV4WNE6_CAEEX|nr:probable RNA-directed DNA polymerase from transposon X-element [Caerostris extrusa]
MIMKPADIHSFMKKINTDLKVKITCKLTTQYLKLEPDTETITKYLDNTNVPYYIITPKNLRPLKVVLRGLLSTLNYAIKNELTDLKFQDLTALHNTFNSYFMDGDFNSHHRHWNCSRANTFGKHLFKFTTDNRLHIAAPPTPNRFDGLESLLITLLTLLTPVTSKKISKLPKSLIFPKKSETKITTRKHLRKIWQSTRHPNDKNNYTLLNNEIKQLIKREKNKNWNNHLNSLSTHDNSLWNTIKSIRKQTHIIPPLKNNNSLSYSNINKANTLSAHNETQFTPNNVTNIPTETLVDSSISRFKTSHITNPNHPDSEINILLSEIIQFIKNLKNNKVPGYDNITNTMLKNIPIKFIFYITDIINALFKIQYFPQLCKSSYCTNLQRVGKDPKLPENYRPISLLPVISKVYENGETRKPSTSHATKAQPATQNSTRPNSKAIQADKNKKPKKRIEDEDGFIPAKHLVCRGTPAVTVPVVQISNNTNHFLSTNPHQR